ncbi:hypothetical protein HGRIS_006284 [Hohenbuehelia grisea]|uniref:Dipeptidyl-peptidase V n=1 Tax=Hohenbuehelia grisea TaxID=104357 RepID=A0ABR3K0R4_9AGAR
MRFPVSLLGFSALQTPLQSPSLPNTNQLAKPAGMNNVNARPNDFTFQEAADLFSPKDLVELRRPGQGVANDAGDFLMVPVSQYSLADKKNKKSLSIFSLASDVAPLDIPLPNGGEAFWLTGRYIAHAVPNESEKKTDIYVFTVDFRPNEGFGGLHRSSEPPALVGSIPTTTASNFRWAHPYLLFSDYVYPDGDLEAVKKNDEAWENRGHSAYVYETTYERHWDTWVGPKRASLFSVRMYQDPDREWHFDGDFVNLLKDTGHSSPVEPFGGTDDFDIAGGNVVYTAKDPELPEAWHTKQNVYIVPITGGTPKELTSGKQGATHSPVFDLWGSKVAWLEMDKDGYEADRSKIVIYDLKRDVRFTVTQDWDRSPDRLAFSKEGNFLYFTAGNEARVNVFVLPVPPTPSYSTTHPKLDKKYTTPTALTHDHAASGLQTLFTGRLIFTQSSFTSPNDVYIISDLHRWEKELEASDGLTPFRFEGKIERKTWFTEDVLEGKYFHEGEEVWFEGAKGKKVQGWVLKPKGWSKDDKKKTWPVALLIHGGPQSAWEDQWSTRWNPNVIANQGYFAVMINPTGSTTFGQEFTDGIAEDWGGKPFVDMQAGWKHVLEKYPEIDPERAVAAGASWGGYAINWIQGHPEYGFNFKALVCHDGVFDANYNGFSTDELFFFNHEWGGRSVEFTNLTRVADHSQEC